MIMYSMVEYDQPLQPSLFIIAAGAAPMQGAASRISVALAGPAHLWGCSRVMAGEFARQTTWKDLAAHPSRSNPEQLRCRRHIDLTIESRTISSSGLFRGSLVLVESRRV
jgi:hypothetical protein